MYKIKYAMTCGTEIPCTQDCPDRSPECHGQCQAYKEYRARMDQRREVRRQQAADTYYSARRADTKKEIAMRKMNRRHA